MSANKKVVLWSSMSAGFEYYDFSIYAMLSLYIAPLFFVHSNAFLQTLAIFAVFAMGYIMRPVGGLIFGHFGDRIGRKKVFILSILLMALTSLLIGVLPTYSQFGVVAPLMLVLLRMLQGLAIGAEVPGALTFLSEQVNTSHLRGFSIGCMVAGVSLFAALGALVAKLVATMRPEQMLAWGWRVPFLFGGLLAILALIVRMRLAETPCFMQLQQVAGQQVLPLKTLLLQYKCAILSACGVVLLPACCIMFNLYLPAFAHEYYHYQLAHIYTVMTLGLLWCALLLPLMGYLADKVGVRRLFVVAIIMFMLLLQPLFALLAAKQVVSLLIFMLVYQTLLAALSVSYMRLLADYFPVSVRYSGVALCYNLVFSLAGVMPIVWASLLSHFHMVNILKESFVLVAIITLSSLYLAPSHAKLVIKNS